MVRFTPIFLKQVLIETVMENKLCFRIYFCGGGKHQRQGPDKSNSKLNFKRKFEVSV